MLKFAKVRWLDNCYREGEHSLDDLGTGAELTYYGLVVKETEVALTLAMEEPQGGRTRNPFDILRRNIIDVQVVDAAKAFRKSRKAKEAKHAKDKNPQVSQEPTPV